MMASTAQDSSRKRRRGSAPCVVSAPTCAWCGLAVEDTNKASGLIGKAKDPVIIRIAQMRFTRLVCTRGTTATVRQSNDSCSTKDVRQGTLNLCVGWHCHPTTIALEASATAAPQASRQRQIPRSDDLRLFRSSDPPFRRKTFL